MISISRSYAISFLLPALIAMSPSAGLAGPVSNDGTSAGADVKPRARALGIRPGVLSPGPFNAITDVTGVRSRTAGVTMVGFRGVIEALPLDKVIDIVQKSGRSPVAPD